MNRWIVASRIFVGLTLMQLVAGVLTFTSAFHIANDDAMLVGMGVFVSAVTFLIAAGYCGAKAEKLHLAYLAN